MNNSNKNIVNIEKSLDMDISYKYKYFEVTADIGFYAYGRTINQSFENAGLAMFNLITDTSNVGILEKRDIKLESEDHVSLLYDYLEELLFLHETEFLLFSEFEVTIKKISSGFKLNGTILGEIIDWNKHVRKSEVKAITFHKMAVDNIAINKIRNKKLDCFRVRGILDL